MAYTSEENSGIANFDDGFGDEDDDILAQAYDESIAIGENSPKPGPSFLQPYQQQGVDASTGFDHAAGGTWVYPINYPLRDYQYAIVEQALFKNTLVSLPTGLGKTFIAAVLMYNFYRWYPRCKVVFMAPSKPLVAQQVEACFNIMGIPQTDISQMTGSMAPNSRVEEWKGKRLFFLTPQVLTNDLVRGICPAQLIKCLVLDEAHRALGNYAYCQVVHELRQRRCEFRILALSATPGSDMRAVKEVVTNLLISHIELRNEDSPDILPYSHHRNIEKIVVPLGTELTNVKNKYMNILRIYVNRLLELKVLFTRDETTLTKFQLLNARDAFRQNPPAGLPPNRFGAVEGLFALSVTLYHALDLMLLHGTRSAYKFLKGTLSGDKNRSYARSELLRNDIFKRLMDDLSKKFDEDSNESTKASSSASSDGIPQASGNSPMKSTKESFILSHPKMAHLCDLVIDHHKKYAAEGQSTRIMIFSQYRDSVLEITEMLQHHEPLVKAMSFVGQGTGGRNSRGISQKEQLRVVKAFKEGGFNTLVSTCVGEEGLDIGDVDLIICYDAPKSPIRLVQRMGRTGRKREGRIVVLITKGKEEQMYNQSQYQKKNINNTLANKDKLFHFLHRTSPRMIPAGLNPVCQKLHMKVEEWQTSRRGRKKTLSSNSRLRFPSKGNSSFHKEKHGFLSDEEWDWYKNNLWIPREECRTIPKPSFMSLVKEDQQGNFIEFGKYQPWHNTLQPTHLFDHSIQTKNLVQLTEFVDLQVTLEKDEDPYGLEMAAFLDKSYLRDNIDEQQLIAPMAEAGDSKKGSKKSKKSKVEKNKKVKNNALITSMFQKISSSAASTRSERNSQISQDVGAFKAEDSSKKGKENVRGTDNDDDDDVVVLDDDFIEASNGNGDEYIIASPVAGPSKVQGGDDHPVPVLAEGKPVNICEDERDDVMVKDYFGSRSNSEMIELPEPIARSPIQVRTPPEMDSFEEQILRECPASPSEVIAAFDNCVRDREKTTVVDDILLSETVSKCLLAEKKTSPILKTSYWKMSTSHLNDNEELPDLLSGIRKDTNMKGDVASNEPSLIKQPTKVKVYAEDSELERCSTSVLSRTNLREIDSKCESNLITPGKVDDRDTSPDVSPVLPSSYKKPIRGNLRICSSTPVSAKRLFRVTTPNLTAIEKNSMLQIGENSVFTPGNEELRRDSGSKKRGLSDSTPTSADRKAPSLIVDSKAPSGNISRIRAKLNRFSAPAKKEVVETTNSSATSKGSENSKNTTDSDESTLTEKNKSDFGESGAKVTSFLEQINDTKQVKSSGGIQEESGREFLQRIMHSESQDDVEGSLKLKNRSMKRKLSDVNKELASVNDVCADIQNDADENCSFKKPRKVLFASNCDDNGSNLNKKSNSNIPVQNNTIDKINFDLSLDDDLFADMDMDVIDKKDKTKDPAEQFAQSEERENCSSSEIPNRIMQKTQNLLSVTQIIDIMDQDTNTSMHNQSISSPGFSRRLNLSKKSPFSSEQSLGSRNTLKSERERKLSHGVMKKDSNELSVSNCEKTPERPDNSMIPNFSLMDGIDFDIDDDIGSETPIQPAVDFNLLGSEEFQPVTGDFAESKPKFQNASPVEKNSNSSFNSISKAKLNSVTKSPSNSSSHSFLSKAKESYCSPSDRTPKRLLSNGATSCMSSRKKSLPFESPEPIAPTQDAAYVWKRRERKGCNIVGSDSEDPSFQNDISDVADRSSNSIQSRSLSDVHQESGSFQAVQDDDDDDDFILDVKVANREAGPSEKSKVIKKPSKSKRKKLDFIEREAEVSTLDVVISSDENDEEDEYENNSFVDDCTELSQDPNVDIKAMYLKSIVSPVKPQNQLRLPPHVHYISDTDENSEVDESEDSFVVGNDVVEYNTEYMGESLLAEDSIMLQAIEENFRCNNMAASKKSHKSKRKRIILNDSSSEEETETKNKRVKLTSPPDVKMTKLDNNLKNKSPDNRNISKLDNKVMSNSIQVTGSHSSTDSLKLDSKVNSNINCAKVLPMKNGQVLNKNFQNKDTGLSSDNFSEEFATSLSSGIQGSDCRANKSENSGRNISQKDFGANSKLGFQKMKMSNPNVASRLSVNNSRFSNEGIPQPTPGTSKEPQRSFLNASGRTSHNPSAQLKVGEGHDATSNITLDKQDVQNSTPDLVLVDSHEVNGGRHIISRLQLHHGLKTAVVQLTYGNYAVSTRMIISRIQVSVFSNSQNREILKKRVQGMLSLFERSVIIIETDKSRHGDSPYNTTHVRSKYVDTITCACSQVTQMKVLYSGNQDETAVLISQLVEQEKSKGYKIPAVPQQIQQWQQVISFYRTLPRVSFVTAICLARNFRTLKEFFNSTPDVIERKGCMSHQRAVEIHQLINRSFRQDMIS